MDQGTIDKIHKFAEQAQERAVKLYKEAEEQKELIQTKNLFDRMLAETRYHSKLNDFFYWSGKATACRGIAVGLELAEVVEREMDEEGACP